MPDSLADGFFVGKRVLVCGPGYVGGAVVETLLTAGARVGVIARTPATVDRFARLGSEGWVADLTDSNAFPSEVGDFDFILVSISSGGGGVEGYRRAYLDSAGELQKWASQSDCRAHLVYTSSTAVYAGDGGCEIDETGRLEEGEERSRILVQAEQRVAQWPAAWTVLRLAGIYGPGRHYLLDQMRSGESMVAGRGDFYLNLAHRSDIVAAILAAWSQPERSAGECFNVADEGRATKAEVVEFLAERLGISCPQFTGVSAPGRRARLPNRIIRNDKLKAALDWRPRFPSYREGYAAILEA